MTNVLLYNNEIHFEMEFTFLINYRETNVSRVGANGPHFACICGHDMSLTRGQILSVKTALRGTDVFGICGPLRLEYSTRRLVAITASLDYE